MSLQRPFTDTLHVTAWHAEARSQAGTPAGWGVALSYSQLLGETWEPFIRVGYADQGGALWQWSASVGLGVHLRAHDLLGLGLNWGRPAASTFGPDLPDQYTVEVYYRLQLTAVVTVTPDVQVLIDPAFNPNADVVAVFGMRLRIAF